MKHQERCLGLKSAIYGHGSCSFPCIYAFIEYFVKCTYIACVTYISKRTAPVAAEILIHSLPGFLSRHLAPRKRYAALYVICYTLYVQCYTYIRMYIHVTCWRTHNCSMCKVSQSVLKKLSDEIQFRGRYRLWDIQCIFCGAAPPLVQCTVQ